MGRKLHELFFILGFLFVLLRTGQGLSCTVDNDCLPLHTTLCQNFTCSSGTCLQTDYFCPPTAPAPCMDVPGVCSLLDGICYYPNIDCSDNDACTNDYCITDPLNPMGSICINEPIPGCTYNATHTVTFDVDDVNSLDMYAIPDTDLIQLCHISTYHGPDSVQLLSFTPYDPCSLNERGSCDNHPLQEESMEAYFIAEAQTATSYPCTPTTAPPFFYALAIPGVLGDFFVWDFGPLPPSMTKNDVVGTVHIHGYVHSVADPTLILMVDLKFSHPLDYASQSPFLGMFPQCYIDVVDPQNWLYFQVWSGTLTATADSAYFGLVIELSSSNIYPQLGLGANGINSNYGLFAKFSWTIIAQPLDTLLHLNTFNTLVQLEVDASLMLVQEDPYCDLFGEPQIEPVNGWQATLIDAGQLLQYCANFTLEDLLGCRNATDPYSSMFAYSNQANDTVEYIGQLYSTTLIPTTCDLICAGEQIIGSAVYNLSLSIMTHGRSEMRFVTSYTNFQVYWVNNVWMCGVNQGNLKVNLRTRIQNTGPNTGLYLCNPRMDTAQETGYPISFTDPFSPACEQIGDYCYQDWVLRTYGAALILDFSGYKPLIWDVCQSAIVTKTVTVAMNLWAIHVGDQSHTNAGDITATFNLYEDRLFTSLYSGATLTDGQELYGLICLDNYQHLDMHVRRVYVCYSLEADILPYDPLNPGVTGCNTPGINVQEKMIYSSDYADAPLLTDPRSYRYGVLYSPPTSADCEGFVFHPKLNTPYSQSIQVVWCAQENGGAGGMIELLTEHHFYSRHVDENEDSSDILFTVECPSGSYYDEHLLMCVTGHANDDDDDGHGEVDASTAAWIFLLILGAAVIATVCCCGNFIRHRLFWSQSQPSKKRTRTPKEKQKQSRLHDFIDIDTTGNKND